MTNQFILDEKLEIVGRGTVLAGSLNFVCRRNVTEITAALGGNPITVDGQKYALVGIEFFNTGFPFKVGDKIALVVREWVEPNEPISLV